MSENQVATCGSLAHTYCRSGFKLPHAEKEGQLDQLGRPRVGFGQRIESRMDAQQLFIRLMDDNSVVKLIHRLPGQATPPLKAESATGPVNEQLPHRLGRRAQKMGFGLPLVLSTQFPVGLVNHLGGKQRLPCRKLTQLPGRDVPKLGIELLEQDFSVVCFVRHPVSAGQIRRKKLAGLLIALRVSV